MGSLLIIPWFIDQVFFKERRRERRAQNRHRAEQSAREEYARIIHAILADYPSAADMPGSPPPYEGVKVAGQPNNHWDRFLIQTLVRGKLTHGSPSPTITY